MILLLILSRVTLLILPFSDLVGLISLQVGLLAEFGLWSFSVINASLLAVVSTLSSIPNFGAIFFVFCMDVSYDVKMLFFFSYFQYLYITLFFNVSSNLLRKNRNTDLLY